MKLVENYFNRLWSVLSVVPGQVGRFRGEMEQENKLAQAAREGRVDPRRHFPMLTEALDAIESGIVYLNKEQVQSRKYGTWIPAERYQADLAERPRPKLAGDLDYLLAPERHVVTVRDTMASVTALSPLGSSYCYHFAHDCLCDMDRARVRVHFDPHTSPIRAALVLAEPFQDRQAGTILTRHAACLDDAPEIIRDFDATSGSDRFHVVFDDTSIDRALKHRDSVRAIVRRESRAIDPDGRRIAQRTEIRAPNRTSSTEIGMDDLASGVRRPVSVSGPSLAPRSSLSEVGSGVRRPSSDLRPRRSRILTTMELIEPKTQ